MKGGGGLGFQLDTSEEDSSYNRIKTLVRLQPLLEGAPAAAVAGGLRVSQVYFLSRPDISRFNASCCGFLVMELLVHHITVAHCNVLYVPVAS